MAGLAHDGEFAGAIQVALVARPARKEWRVCLAGSRPAVSSLGRASSTSRVESAERNPPHPNYRRSPRLLGFAT